MGRVTAHARLAGLVDYRARGGADRCRPMSADDFECN
jgi:hypothetical protein